MRLPTPSPAVLRCGLLVALVMVSLPVSYAPAAEADPVIAEADWLLSMQIGSGPEAGLIPMNEPRSLCVPYFSNMAATGLASATLSTGDGRYATAAWRWLQWYASRMDDRGFVTDYELSNGVWRSTGDFDSTDAYAATFLTAVRAAHAATGDEAKLAAIWPAVRRAADAILATAAPGYLTYAKPGWNLKYAMDNAEVYEGWVALAELAEVRGDASLRTLAGEWISGMRASLATYWNEANGAYDVAIAQDGTRRPADWNEFYPSLSAQVWMINTGLVPQDRAAALVARIEQTSPDWDDPASDGLFNPPEGPVVRAIGWWPSFADAFAEAGQHSRALTAFSRLREAAVASARSWPYHVGSAGQMIEFVVERPDTVITAAPAAWTRDRTAVVSFVGTPTAVTFECSLDAAAWQPCASPVTWPALSDGPHNVRVRALDGGGHPDPIPASRAWIVDTVAPSVRLADAPPDPGGIGSARFSFDGADDRTAAASLRFECSLDAAAFAPCEAPASYPGIATGPHVFRVRAVDAAGNASPEAAHSWFADSGAPETRITAGPSGAIWDEQAVLEFDGFDDATAAPAFECRLGAGAYGPCTSPVVYPLRHEGAFFFSVRALDGAGNRDATPATRSWFVDRTPPETSIVSGPEAATKARTARFDFSGRDTVSPSHWIAFECRLDDAPFARCTSPVTFSALADGPHVFEVRAVDAAGWADPSPSRLAWTIDTVSPTSTFTTVDQSVLFDAPPVRSRQVTGRVTDDGTGVRQVEVVFTAVDGSAVRVVAALACADATARSCEWEASPPVRAGRYHVRVFAIDRAGTAESPGPRPIGVFALPA